MPAELLQADLTFARRGDGHDLGRRSTQLGAAVGLIDDEPDLVQPTLEDAHPGDFHESLTIDLDGIAGFFRRDEP